MGSYSPVVHTRVLAHPAIRPLLHASPVVFHPVPSSAANLVTSSDDNADDEQEERKAKEALVVEETKSTIDSEVSTEVSQTTSTVAPATQPPTTQPPTTQPPAPVTTEGLPKEVVSEVPVLSEGVPPSAPENVDIVESQPQYYYYKFF